MIILSSILGIIVSYSVAAPRAIEPVILRSGLETAAHDLTLPNHLDSFEQNQAVDPPLAVGFTTEELRAIDPYLDLESSLKLKELLYFAPGAEIEEQRDSRPNISRLISDKMYREKRKQLLLNTLDLFALEHLKPRLDDAMATMSRRMVAESLFNGARLRGPLAADDIVPLKSESAVLKESGWQPLFTLHYPIIGSPPLSKRTGSPMLLKYGGVYIPGIPYLNSDDPLHSIKAAMIRFFPYLPQPAAGRPGFVLPAFVQFAVMTEKHTGFSPLLSNGDRNLENAKYVYLRCFADAVLMLFDEHDLYTHWAVLMSLGDKAREIADLATTILGITRILRAETEPIADIWFIGKELRGLSAQMLHDFLGFDETLRPKELKEMLRASGVNGQLIHWLRLAHEASFYDVFQYLKHREQQGSVASGWLLDELNSRPAAHARLKVPH